MYTLRGHMVRAASAVQTDPAAEDILFSGSERDPCWTEKEPLDLAP